MISDKSSVIPQGPPKTKVKETIIETINSPSVAVRLRSRSLRRGQGADLQFRFQSISTPKAPGSDSDGSDEEEDAATLTPSALAFSHTRPGDFPAAFKAISDDPSLLQEATTDALLVEAFTAAMKGSDARAKQCVEKGLMIQYCLQLGRDGVSLYFRRFALLSPHLFPFH